MKKTAISFFVLIILYFGTKLFFSERLNPSSFIIENKVIELPKKMNIKSIFGSADREKTFSFIGLRFTKEPYCVQYPIDSKTYILIANKKESAIVVFDPFLNINTNSNWSHYGDCLISDKSDKISLLINNHGYAIQSDSKTLKKDLLEKICKRK